jgi:2-oxoglutarate ferredoxin oxidoreductase subunit beta
MKGLTELITKAIEHDGFSFLNVMSPCVTWRGDDEFKRLKAMHKKLPEDHDPSRRANAIGYTREKDVMTTGVLYEVEAPTMIDRVEAIKAEAMGGRPAPSTKEILKTFYPSF